MFEYFKLHSLEYLSITACSEYSPFAPVKRVPVIQLFESEVSRKPLLMLKRLACRERTSSLSVDGVRCCVVSKFEKVVPGSLTVFTIFFTESSSYVAVFCFLSFPTSDAGSCA